MATAALAATPAWSGADTTVQRTIQDTDGDNLLESAPGEDYTVVGGPQSFRPPRKGSLLNFLQLSDFQIADEESPGRVEFLDGSQRVPGLNPFSAAYRPQETLTTQITEAMVRQARDTRSPITGKPLDLTILTGDNADSQQYNETRWFIDTLDGKSKIDPNSGVEGSCGTTRDGSVYDGVRDDGQAGVPDNGYYEPDSSDGRDGDGYSPNRQQNAAESGQDVTVRDFPGLFESAQRPFEATGLGMPWYSAFGNHDALVQGNSPDAYVGPFGGGGESVNPAYDALVRGCAKPSKLPSGMDTEAGVEQYLRSPAAFLGDSAPVNVPRDDRRCHLSKDKPTVAEKPCTRGWIAEHSITKGEPKGHGFTAFRDHDQRGDGRPPSAVVNHDGYYSFVPRKGLRFIVLDTITDECAVPVCSEGSIDDPQFQWLGGQIQEAAARGEYVMVFSHHTERTIRFESTDASERPIHYGERFDRRGNQPVRPDAVEPTLEELLCASPNVLAHVDGHEHQNYVLEHQCANSFYEVSTSAHIDWPQQSRMLELFDNGNRTLSLALTMLDHEGQPDPGAGPAGTSILRLASIGREIAYNDYQGSRSARGERSDRNVIVKLDKPFPYRPH